MKTNKNLFSLAIITVIFLSIMFFLREYNLKWVQVKENTATVTINFLFPMNKDKFEESIKIQNSVPNADQFTCQLEWKTDTTVQIIIKETSDIKGQKIWLQIDSAPTTIWGLKKNANIDIQFKSPVAIINPLEEFLISTEQAFEVHFNTPMSKKTLNKYLQSDASFYIDEAKITLPNGNQVIDHTKFIFRPKKPLENGRKYILSFRKGMPSESGTMLSDNISIVLQTDIKPQINEVYPQTGSKWIGLYPKILLETNTKIKNAYIFVEGQKIQGKLVGEQRAEFLLDKVLKPNTTYNMQLQVEAPTGELSELKEISFTTVPINDTRIWVEVVLGDRQEIVIYKGNNPIKTIVCSGGSTKTPTPLGTYYILEKEEKYFDDVKNEGANAWLRLSEGVKLHGLPRDEYWNIKQRIANNLGSAQTNGDIVVEDEDAVWLYNYLPVDTMVIVHD